MRLESPWKFYALFLNFQKYALTISKQIEAKNLGKGIKIGEALATDDLDKFNEEQLHQLFDLYQETSKPQDEYPR